ATSAQHRARLLVCLGVLAVLAFLGSCDDRQGSVSPPDTLVVVGGAGQPAIVGEELAEPVVVQASDGRGRPVRGVRVTWSLVVDGQPRADLIVEADDRT